jgi:dTDP-glucose 4,6-dehydratase
MRLLVTGGAGFIGRNLISLIERKYDHLFSSVIVFDSLTYAGSADNIFRSDNEDKYRFTCGDIKIFDEILLATKEIDVVINFAAESHVDRSLNSPSLFLETNTIGAFNVFESCRRNKISKIIQISTDEVYGSVGTGMSREEDALSPNSPYSASKASADLIARAMFETFKLPVVITRCTNNYGEFQHPEKMIPMFVTELLEGRDIPIYGKGNNVREWIHVDDHCEAIILALLSGEPGKIYNIGSGIESTNIEVAKTILKVLELDSSRIIHVEDRLGHDFRYRLDFARAESELRYKPRVDFANGLNETIQWYVSNEKWWKPLKSIRDLV